MNPLLFLRARSFWWSAVTGLGSWGFAQTAAPSEADYYAVDYLVPPSGERLEVGGLAFLPDGRLVVSTRRGQVWIVHDPLARDPREARFTLFAEGLWEGLGLATEGERIFVLQRTELSELIDRDRDGRCDEVRTLADDWGVSGHYHEFAFGLPRDRAGNFYASLNVSFGDPQWWHGRSTAPYRGWVLQIGADGRCTPFASGLRSPCGLGTNLAGDLFATDNQGDWMPACPIFHVRHDDFFGHPASLNWSPSYREAGRIASDTIPPTTPRAPAAVWIPYDWSRSAGSLVADDTGGKFGPFAGQMFVAELTNGMVLRAILEKVGGEYQGAVMPFRQRVGSAVRVAFASDGTLFAGFTDRGWGGQAPADGIGRIRPTGRAPLEISDVRLREEGFDLRFTLPLRAAPQASEIRVYQYDYDYWWEYGSPARHQEALSVSAVRWSDDGASARLTIPGLRAGRCVRVRLDGLVSAGGERLLHEEFAYTIQRLADGEAPEPVAKLVPPPPAKERSAEGMVELAWDDVLDSWNAPGWRVIHGDVALDPDDPKQLALREEEGGEPILVPAAGGGPRTGDLVSRYEFGDVDVHVDFLLPQGGNSGLYLMGRYEVQLLDSTGKQDLGAGDCGGLYPGERVDAWKGRAPMFNAFRGPGQWHGLTVRFRAPRFDAQGRKVTPARFERVMIDDVLLHENVEVATPTRGAFADPAELAVGPLRLQGDHGSVAFKNIWVRPVAAAPADEQAWDESTWKGFATRAGWSFDDDGALHGADGALDLEWAAPEWPNGAAGLVVAFEAKLPRGTRSALVLDSARSGEGAALDLSVRPEAGPRAGSLRNGRAIAAQLLPTDLWFRVEFECRDLPGGRLLRARLNGMEVFEHQERAPALESGARRLGSLRIEGPRGGGMALRNLRWRTAAGD